MITPRLFGVELEGFTDENMRHQSIRVDGIDFDGKEDGSLNEDYNNYSVEFVSPPIDNTGYIESVYEILNNRYAWEVNSSAGLHIHVDADDYRAKDFYKLLLLMTVVEPLIYSITDSRRYHNSYTKSLNRAYHEVQRVLDQGYDEINQVCDVEFAEGDRYFGLNFDAFHNHSTVEFRYFAAQETSSKVIKYVELVTKLVEFNKAATIDQIRVIVKDLIDEDLRTVASRLKDIFDLSFDLASCRENDVYESYIRDFNIEHAVSYAQVV